MEAESAQVRQWMTQAAAAAGSGRTGEAALLLTRATVADPNAPEPWQMLGDVLLARGQRAAAVGAYQRALAIRPDAHVYLNLGSALAGLEQIDPSIDALQAAVRLAPNSSEAHRLLGSALCSAGELEPALGQIRTALELNPANDAAHSLLLYAMLFQGVTPPAELKAAHQQWAARQTAHIRRLPPPPNEPSPDRRLRVGYVSPNFYNQAVAPFLLPIFENHDPWEVDVFCYSDVTSPDATTARLRANPDTWRETASLSHAALAEQIRADAIDILVDLTGHIGGGRLQTFAAKPAPIQIAYLGYQATTGLAEMDYALTDDWADPPGQTEAFWVETPWRLPGTFFCYEPHRNVSPPVGPLPARARGAVTFGCLNNVIKTTPRTLNVWAQVMSALPAARLMLLVPHGERTHARIHAEFGRRGVDPTRLELVGRASVRDYLDRYNQIDLALDPIPFPGHTTTCDAAWMGVPTVCLAGNCYAYRYGSAVMKHLGLADWIVTSDDEYVSLAITSALNLSRLAELRDSLRTRMQQSPLCDGRAFTRNLESAYRSMWQRWCTARGAGR